MGAERTAILIAGPTASGKSALAVRLAERLGGLVINADAMQCYRDLRVLTARPSQDEERRAPHALYGTVDGGTNHSVTLWLADMAIALARAAAEERVPIVVGGSGLYFKALTEGLSDIPAVPDAVRQEIRAWAAERTAPELHAALAARDPETAARLRPSDPQRLIRALEVNAATGGSLAAFQLRRGTPLLAAADAHGWALQIDRETLWTRADRRFDAMMADGAIEEVRALRSRRLDGALPITRAHGVPPLLRYLDGEIDQDAATAQAKLDTRHYIKRQETFVRTQLRFDPVAPDRAETLILSARGQLA